MSFIRGPDQIRWQAIDSPLGQIVVAVSSAGICAIGLFDTEVEGLDDLLRAFPRAQRTRADLGDLTYRVRDQLMHPHQAQDLPIDMHGTDYQKTIWAGIQGIPLGQTLSYARLAEQLDMPKSARAIAGACAANLMAGIVPCHRVVLASGAAAGFRWGPGRRAQLLELEGVRLA